MEETIAPPDDGFQIRCPRLGHQIFFSYCRQENMGIPCRRILDCWYTYFPVVEFLEQELSPEEWQSAFGRPVKPKMTSLVEILEKVLKDKGSRQKAQGVRHKAKGARQKAKGVRQKAKC